MIDYLHHIGQETATFNRAVAAIDQPGDSGAALATAPARTCGDWSAADLTWHLAEVQFFWAAIVEDNLTGPDQVARPGRPDDDQLVAFHRTQGERLLSALEGRDPEEPCWTWHPAGNTIGWVLRRQAHEALIHRIDAELAAGAHRPEAEPFTAVLSPIDQTLAADGVDEILNVMLNVGPDDDLTFTPDGTSVRLACPTRSWDMHLGQAAGTGSGAVGVGEPIDLPALQLAPLTGDPTVEVRADASVLDLWLWRRGTLPAGTVTGDTAVAEQLSELAKIE